MTGLPAMTPSAKERAEQAMIRAQILAIEAAYRDGAAAERARILALIVEAAADNDSELADRLADVFNSGPAHTSITERQKRWVRALADEIEKGTQ